MIDVDDEIAKTITKRAFKLDFKAVYKLIGDKPFLLAGGALCGDEVHDFDLYPDEEDGKPFDLQEVAKAIKDPASGATLLFESKNALTVKLNEKGQVVQFCVYRKPSLEELVKSFDFSHIQVGIRFRGNGCAPYHEHVFYTDAFVVANVTRRTVYTGSEYPMSSLMRLFKYHKRGKLMKREAAQATMKILKDVLERGYENYEDYKKQLDAIDLQYEGMQEAFDLYKAFCDKGLCQHVRGESLNDV